MEKIDTELTRMLDIRYPVIMAPMFLVSNAKMTIEAIRSGITGAIPALNYRTDQDFRDALVEIKNKAGGPFGINIIVNKSNPRRHEQLKTCVEFKVDFIITSLGSPEDVIREAHKHGIKVFCDVTDVKYAKKVEALGADGLIAVNSLAGGHAGPLPPEKLIPMLRENCRIPIISAGGVGTGQGLKHMLDLGACGISMGSPFIACEESDVTPEYKQAIISYGADDVVMTTKLSGTPSTVINTPYVQKVGTRQNWLERVLNNFKPLKKLVKMLTFYKGMKALEEAALSTTYKTVWVAGPSIEYVKSVRPVSEIVKTMINEYENQLSFKEREND